MRDRNRRDNEEQEREQPPARTRDEPQSRFYVHEHDEELTEEALCEGLNPHDIGMIAMMNVGSTYDLEVGGVFYTIERTS